jgi:hypothetical protein
LQKEKRTPNFFGVRSLKSTIELIFEFYKLNAYIIREEYRTDQQGWQESHP